MKYGILIISFLCSKLAISIYYKYNIVSNTFKELIYALSAGIFLILEILFCYNIFYNNIKIINYDFLLTAWIFFYFYFIVKAVLTMFLLEAVHHKYKIKKASFHDIFELLFCLILFVCLKNIYFAFDLPILFFSIFFIIISKIIEFKSSKINTVIICIEQAMYMLFICMFYIAAYSLLAAMIFLFVLQIALYLKIRIKI